MISTLMGSIKSVGIGFLLFLASFPFIFYNECNAVAVYKSIDEGQKISRSVNSKTVQNSNNGKLIVTNGKATTSETITDPAFGLGENALKLVRSVEMYQWQEKKPSEKEKKKGEKTTYSKKWSSVHRSSSRFEYKTGHYNPPMVIKNTTIYAKHAKLGAFQLKQNLLTKISASTKIELTQKQAYSLRSPVAKPKRVSEKYLYLGSPSSPLVGDYRVTFSVARPQDATVLAQQMGLSFTSWKAKNGKRLFNLRSGIKNAKTMFELERDDNFFWTMVKRLGSFIGMAIALMLIFKPLTAIADMVPFVGDFLEAGINFFAILVAAFLTFITIGIAWVVARPLFGLLLIAIAIAVIVGLMKLAKSKKAAKAAAA